MGPEVVVEEIAEALRELGAREPGLVRDGERVLDERELAALLFGSNARVSPRSLTGGGAPEWFETRVAVHVDAAWLSEAEARSVLDRLRALPVRVTKARVDASAAMDPAKLRFVLVLEMLRHEKPGPAPPARRAVKRRNAGESLGPNRMACGAALVRAFWKRRLRARPRGPRALTLATRRATAGRAGRTRARGPGHRLRPS
jgi:hypothetical protein